MKLYHYICCSLCLQKSETKVREKMKITCHWWRKTGLSKQCLLLLLCPCFIVSFFFLLNNLCRFSTFKVVLLRTLSVESLKLESNALSISLVAWPKKTTHNFCFGLGLPQLWCKMLRAWPGRSEGQFRVILINVTL